MANLTKSESELIEKYKELKRKIPSQDTINTYVNFTTTALCIPRNEVIKLYGLYNNEQWNNLLFNIEFKTGLKLTFENDK